MRKRIDSATADRIIADAKSEVAQALLEAEAAPLPDPSVILKDVFA
jgi:pyruvate dehydrogenase E1 component alpha subunit